MLLWLLISVVVGFIRSADFSRHRATSNNVTGPEAICRKKSHSLSQKEQQLWNLGDGDRLNEQSSFCNEESELPVGFHRTAHASVVAIIHDGCDGTRLIERKLHFEELVGLPAN